MSEKKYLNGFQKLAYASGQISSNLGYALVTSFMMIYLTNAVGLNSAVIGTLILVSRIFDGVTDVFFGSMIDRTKTKLGKARPWLLFGEIGVCIALILVFCVPAMSETMQYVYFFVFYTALNAIFYTATGISYSALSAKITRNANERVQLGSIGGIFATITYLIVMSLTMGLVEAFGGGAKGWRMVAILFALLALIINTFCVLSVKELPDEETDSSASSAQSQSTETLGLLASLRTLLKNPYFLIILSIYIVFYTSSGLSAATVYFCTYFLGNPSLQGILSLVASLPMVIVAALTPVLVKKFGSMRKLNLVGRLLALAAGVLAAFAALQKNIPLFLAASFLVGIGTAPFNGTGNALIAETADYTYRVEGKRLDGTFFSCSAIGVKVGGGFGSAIVGILLDLGGFDGLLAVQSDSAIHMIYFIQVVLPLLFGVLLIVLFHFLKVEQANKSLQPQETE
ncbi:MAG: MFS transporter [Lachnospiraceae bacterium]|nr:MFS transporter [Lachnospiraceae bacterium]